MNTLAAAVIAILMAFAGLHVYWGLGGLWPGRTEADLLARVVGLRRGMMPGLGACLAVALALLSAAYIVAVRQVGVEPNRIDLMNDISGVSWEEAWAGRTEITIEGIPVPVLGIEEFVRNKRASGRPKDRADLILIGRE